jgi:hypothetical protein
LLPAQVEVLLARAVVLQARRDTAGGAAISNTKVGEEGKFLRWFLLFLLFPRYSVDHKSDG